MKKIVRKTFIILFWIAVWGILARVVDNSILVATPYQTVRELFLMLGETDFYRTVTMSLLRIALGFFAGFFVGVGLAAAGSRFSWLEEVLKPIMSLMKTVPVASFVVLFLIWWGSSFLATAISFLVVLPNIYISTLEGLKNVDRELMEMGRVFRLPLSSRFFYIYRVALRPYLCSSMKVALGMSWKSGVAAEVIGIPAYSVGEQLYLSKIYLNTAGVFAWTAVVILLSVLFEGLVLRLADRFFRWEPECGKPTRKGDSEAVFKNVGKRFGDIIVLEEKSAVFERGRVYYLREPSGSGKTTTLRLLAGLEKPDKGEVSVPDCSMVFQEDRLCLGYSAVKNVELVTGNREKAREALELLLESEALDKPCEELSGGMKRRVALVRAMEAESECVLLDEPFTGMDGEVRARAEEYIRSRQKGRTLVIATHI